MILCMNANAAVDKTAVVSPFHLNEIHRPQQVLALPGGKGCNVARALRTLGDDPAMTGWVGGFAGQFIEAALQREGIATTFVHTDSESRTCLSILDPDAGTLTELYENGDPISADKLTELTELFRRSVVGCTAVTLSGSLPAGVPADFYARLIEIARAAGVPAYLDVGREALKRGLAAKPALIKPNRKEFADLVGDLTSTEAYVAAASEIAARYDTTVVLSLGADGAIGAVGTNVWRVRPPQVKIVSAVGSGDCLLAGVTHCLTAGGSLEDALRCGVAAGTANALRLGAGLFTPEDYDRIYPDVSVERL
jgi:tagatose 6-phosphate kinase